MSALRSCLAAISLALVLAAPAAAQPRPERMHRDLAAELRKPEIQQQLIAAGSLDALVGRASYSELREAIELFRKAFGFHQNGMKPLTPVEKAKLAAIYKEFQESTGLEEKMHTQPDQSKPEIKRTLELLLPLKLVKAEPEQEGDGHDKWLTYTASRPNPDGNGRTIYVGIGPVIYPLSSYTPISLFRDRIVEAAVQFDGLHLTSDEFIGRGKFGENNAVTSYNMVLSHDSELRGLFMRYRNDVLPSGFKVPDFLIQTAGAEPVTSETEKIEPTVRGWQLLMQGLTNLIASHFPFGNDGENGWKKVSTADCPLNNEEDDDQDKIRILFGTDRAVVNPDRNGTIADPDSLFTTKSGGALQLGCAYVSKSAAEALTWDKLISGFKFIRTSARKGDFGDRLYLTNETGGYRSQNGDASAKAAAGSTAGGAKARRRGRSDALLFIHGYNVPFKYALQTAAKVANDIDYKGRVYVYSWPSAESNLQYIQDLDRAEQAEPYFQSFMRMLMRDANIREIDILAHSMGSQTLLRSLSALRSIFESNRGGRLQTLEAEEEGRWARPGSIRIGQLIFAAPDVDRSVFDQKIRRIAPYAKRVTIYVSSSDVALLASKTLRSGVARVGQLDDDGKPIRVDLDNVHVIDATWKEAWYSWDRLKRLFTGYGHDYFSQAEPILLDIKDILMARRDQEQITPSERAPGRFATRSYDAKSGDGTPRSYWELTWTATPK